MIRIDRLKDVFISYRSTQVEYARRLCDELKQHGVSVWFDKDYLNENVGDKYKGIIQEAIRNSRIFLLIYTDDVAESDFILKEELGYASSLADKKVGTPIKIFSYAKDKVDFNKMKSASPYLYSLLAERQWIADSVSAEHISKVQEQLSDEKKRAELDSSISGLSKQFGIYEDENMFLVRIAVQKALGMVTPYGRYQRLAYADTVYAHSRIELNVVNKALYIPIPKEYEAKLDALKFEPKTSRQRKQQEELEEAFKEMSSLLQKLQPETVPMRKKLDKFITSRYDVQEIFAWMKENVKKKFLKNVEVSVEGLLEVVARKVADSIVRQMSKKKRTYFNGAMLGVYDITDGRTKNLECHDLTMNLYHSDYFTFKCTVELYHILCSVKDCFGKVGISNINEYSPFLCSLGVGGFVVTDQASDLKLMWAKRSGIISSGDMWHFSYDETVNLLKDAVRVVEKDGKPGEIKIFGKKQLKVDAYKTLYRGIYEENGLSYNLLSDMKGIVEVGLIKSDRLEVELLSYAKIELPATSSVYDQMRDFHMVAPDGYLEISAMEFSDLTLGSSGHVGDLLTPESESLSRLLKSGSMKYFGVHEGVRMQAHVHIAPDAEVGEGTVIEHYSEICSGARVGKNCKLHRNVFVDENVVIGDNVKIQNNNSIYRGVTLEDGVFVGTNVSFTNDRWPRSVREDGKPVTVMDWQMETTTVCKGASIGSGAVIRCGITIGEGAMVGCGAVVTKDVEPYDVVAGNPAKVIGRVKGY